MINFLKGGNRLLIFMLITIIIFIIVVMQLMPDGVLTGEEPVQVDLTVYIAAGPEGGADQDVAAKIAEMFTENGINSVPIASADGADSVSKIQDGSATAAILTPAEMTAAGDAVVHMTDLPNGKVLVATATYPERAVGALQSLLTQHLDEIL